MLSSLESHVDLPVIDISQFPSDFDGEGVIHLKNYPGLAAVKEACKEIGFFSVVNHGIPLKLFQDVESVIYELCAMPADAKQRAVTSNPVKSYSHTTSAESFAMSESPDPDYNSVQDLSRKIWPEEGNRRFRKSEIEDSDLARKIAKIIIASMGLHVETFYHSDFEKLAPSLCVNHYYCNGKSLEEGILVPHRDLTCCTILYQDNKWGLQFRSNAGEWLNVRPQAHLLVVNVGDSLKAWNNGRYRSAEHRAVCKGSADRYSVAFFVNFPDDKEIWAPAELVDDDHPRRYRSFIMSQFLHDYLNSLERKEGKSSAFLDRYAGFKV